MVETDKDSQKPATSEQDGPNSQQVSEDYPAIPTILQHSANKEGCVYRDSNKSGKSL